MTFNIRSPLSAVKGSSADCVPPAPLVGIAIPAYNAAETLEETLRSCLAQTVTDWVAYVTVDGGECGPEQQIVARLNDPRIRLQWNGRCLGQFENFNRAMLSCYAAGVGWIKLLCADDILHPNALERMLAVGQQGPACGLVYGYYRGIDGTGRVVTHCDVSHIATRVVPSEEYVLVALPGWNPVGGPSSVMLRASVLDRCGIFDARLDYSGDADFWFRVVTQFDVGVVGESPILDYRFHENSVTGRGYNSARRFEQPLDIVRNLIARSVPFSRRWFMAQALLGRTAASNFLTAAAFVRRGDLSLAMTGLWTTVRRLSFWAAPVAPIDFVFRLALLLTGHRPARHNPYEPSEHETAEIPRYSSTGAGRV
jgi:glycosyltransferase involved in cell wall biosynthesis